MDGVSFSVAPGEVYGLLGPNGAGKTTTVRMVVGLLQPDSGYAEVHNYRTSAATDEVKMRIGLVSAQDGVYPWLSVREMLLFFADLYGVPSELARQNVDFLAGLLQLESFLDRRCANPQHRAKATRDPGSRLDLTIRPSCCWMSQRGVWT